MRPSRFTPDFVRRTFSTFHLGCRSESGASANLISAELANGIVEGYRISLQRTEAGYGITARSLNRDYPSFYSDQTLKTQTINHINL